MDQVSGRPPLLGLRVTAAAAGDSHTLALTADGQVPCPKNQPRFSGLFFLVTLTETQCAAALESQTSGFALTAD
jgi:hypothetical protein